jgi:hypothetical protein
VIWGRRGKGGGGRGEGGGCRDQINQIQTSLSGHILSHKLAWKKLSLLLLEGDFMVFLISGNLRVSAANI